MYSILGVPGQVEAGGSRQPEKDNRRRSELAPASTLPGCRQRQTC